MWYVYIIKSQRVDYKYTGSTNDLKRRMLQHNEGLCQSSRPYRPFVLEAYIAVKDKDRAIKLEQYLKTGSGKAFLSKRLL